MEINVENLERAVSQFYHSDSMLQAQAHQWLTAVQSSPNAWSFVWDLLQPGRSREAQFFAATTLHMKIMKNWGEVPPEQYGNLKNKLLETIIQYSGGQELVLNRLCIALSALVIQITPRYWEDSIGDLLSMFRPQVFPSVAPQRVVWILLEVLTVIPEEFQTMTLSSTHKNLVRNELEKNSIKVFSLLEELLSSGEVREVAVKAAVAWLQLGVSLPSCLRLAECLVSIVTAKLPDITESCEHELEALNQMCSHPDTHNYPGTIIQLLALIIPLTQQIHTSGNEEALNNVYKVLIGIGETHTRLLLTSLRAESGHLVRALISALLDCTSTPGDYPKDETRSQLVFGFWYILQDEMMNLDKDEIEYVCGILVPVYERLCEVLLHKSKLPNDIDMLSAADQELIRIYRQDISDTIVYCYYVAREHLIRLLVRCQHGATSWQDAEAVLHVALALAVTATAQDDQAVIGLLVNTPSQFLNTRVINVLNQAIGAYAEWLGQALPRVIPGLIDSLQSTDTATSATMALKDITRERTTSLIPFAPGLLTASQEALNKGHLKQTEAVRLMYSVGRLMSVLPYPQMMSSLEPLVSSYVQNIEQYAASQQTLPLLLLRLRMLSTLCSSLYSMESGPDPPSLIILTRLLPILSGVCQRWTQHHSVIEEVCHCLNTCVINVLNSAKAVLQPVAELGAACFSVQPNRNALDLTRQVCILFGSTETDVVSRLLESVSDDTQRFGQGLAPEVLQAYFNLVTSVVKKTPPLLAKSLDTNRLFRFGTECLTLAEAPTMKAAGSFLSAFIAQSSEEPALYPPIRDSGSYLVNTCLHCIGGQTPRTGLDIFAEILLSLNKRSPELLSTWLTSGLTNLPGGQSVNKENFAKAVLRERSNKRKLSETIKEFALITRGIIVEDFDAP